MNLPKLFLDNMKQLLSTEFEAYLESYEKPCSHGLRLNTWKIGKDEWDEHISPFSLPPIPWTTNGYFYDEETLPAKNPYYYAGLYYLQEPSAMTPAQLLPVCPGDMVLDLCAAPGGKSTELGARLKGTGLLIANDISSSRAKALLKNIELFGIANACVTSESPEKLAETFGCMFDKILIDAPCSGEGMFRKDPGLIRSWLEHGPEYYAKIQQEILTQAVKMLKPGGCLLYSTCTFSPLEDEDTINRFLLQNPDMKLVPLPLFAGAVGGIHDEPVLRLFPHKIDGEGHFVALLGKVRKEILPETGQQQNISTQKPVPIRKDWERLDRETDFFLFMAMVDRQFDRTRLMVKQDMVYYLPEGFAGHWKLRYLRTGLLLGELKKGRFEPSQAFAMALRREEFSQTISFSYEDERISRYLKGETISLRAEEPEIKGWCLVCIEGYPLGWGKGAGKTIKNKYYPGWRLQGGMAW